MLEKRKKYKCIEFNFLREEISKCYILNGFWGKSEHT